MTTLDHLTASLMDVPIYTVNGLLILVFWFTSQAPVLASLMSAALIALLPDAEVQRRAAFRPAREGEITERSMPRTAQVITLLVFSAWVVAQWGMGEPVPWIGACMWGAGLLAILVLPGQRFNLLWYVKAGIAIYALTVLGSRVYLTNTTTLTPEQWAALVGSTESAAAILANTRSNVTTIVLWILWLVVPLGYFSMLVQQIFINPMSIVSPLAGAQEVIKSLRVRRTG
ncbi:MAG: hypothetical protein PHQ40_08665 [Anaerolineaceae bacterium]|nr:hypothetical protein [Anaerolineaceae bacterium]